MAFLAWYSCSLDGTIVPAAGFTKPDIAKGEIAEERSTLADNIGTLIDRKNDDFVENVRRMKEEGGLRARHSKKTPLPKKLPVSLGSLEIAVPRFVVRQSSPISRSRR